MEAITSDSFTECFEQRPPEPWNFNFLLFILWCLGVLVRYLILLPIRMLYFIVGSLIFGFIYTGIYLLPESERKTRIIRNAIRLCKKEEKN